jgi:hypothetical protein
MKKYLSSYAVLLFLLFGFSGVSNAVIIDFTGGIAYLTDGSTVVTNDTDPYYYNVDYYVEDGIRIDFIGGSGIIGNYYGADKFGNPAYQNSVIHAHWDVLDSIQFSKVDGSAMSLNYVDLTSNTENEGGASTGNEFSHITSSNGDSMQLPSSDWGVGYLSDGTTPGDGIERLWLNSDFDDITAFIITSENAECFGLDNFYIDEAAPPTDPVSPVPEPSTMLLLGLGFSGIALCGKKKLKL